MSHSSRILLHGYLCVYSSYGFIICVLVGNSNGTLRSIFFTTGAADAIGMCLIAVNPLRVAASRAWSFEFAMKIRDARIAVTRSSRFDATCREIATKLRREFSARLCVVDVIMKSLRMQLAGCVDVGASVPTNGSTRCRYCR